MVRGRPGAREPHLKAWCVAYLAQDAPAAEVAALGQRLAATEGGWRELVEVTLQARADDVLRGAARVLCAGDRDAARRGLMQRISTCSDWQQGVHRGRNCGLALRLVGTADDVAELAELIRGYGTDQPAEDALVALGFRGDDAAIPFLVQMALASKPVTRDATCAAAEGLSFLGTKAGLAACADVARRSTDSEVQWRSLRGMSLAMETPCYRASLLPADPPTWARALTRAEAVAVCRPLLETLEGVADKPLATRVGRLLAEARTVASTP